jgi:hypothetical protein
MGMLRSLGGAANGCNDGAAIPQQRGTTVRSGERHTGDGQDRSKPEVREGGATMGQTTASHSGGTRGEEGKQRELGAAGVVMGGCLVGEIEAQ